MRGVFLTLFIAVLVLLDQMSKWWIIEMFFRPRVFEAQGASQPFLDWLVSYGQDLFPPARVEVTSFFNLVMVWNKGVSFGMFTSGHDVMPYILGGTALLLCVILAVWMSRAKHLTTLIPLAMIISGAIANVWDRARFGAVTDFLDFHIGDMHYPSFNIADCCIVVGVIALAIDGFFFEPKRAGKDVESKCAVNS